MDLSGLGKSKNWFHGLTLCALLALSVTAVADEVLIYYIDDAGETQTLSIDANSSDADNALAATLILEGSELIMQGSKILVTLDEKEDLEAIADAVAAHAPDNATATAIRNTILGVGPYLGGRSVVRMPEEVDTPPVQVDTPPLPPPAPAPPSPSSSIPPPSSSVVSPN